MPLLSHQLILHPDIVGQFVLQKPVTPYERRVGFTWYVCPVKIANEQEWLLVNAEFGYCALADTGSAPDIERAALDAIDLHLPDEREDDKVSVSFNPDSIRWHTAAKMPEHVAKRYEQALKQIRKCSNCHDAEDEIEQLNDTALTVGGRTFTPAEGLEGLLLELADHYSHYIKTTPWWKVWWHAKADRQPWLALGYGRQSGEILLAQVWQRHTQKLTIKTEE